MACQPISNSCLQKKWRKAKGLIFYLGSSPNNNAPVLCILQLRVVWEQTSDKNAIVYAELQ
jgi:hypothetical protein